MRWMYSAVLAGSLVLAAACGSKQSGFVDGTAGTDDGGAPKTDTLQIVPADQVIDVADNTPAAAIDYKAVIAHPNGSSEDVTNASTFATTGLGDDIGLFTANTFRPAAGKVGKTTIQATNGALSATTTLTIRRAAIVLGPGAPPDAPGRFGGAEDQGLAPNVVYPPDGVMLPPNMNGIEVHFEPKSANLFELHVTSSVLELKVYFGCQAVGSGCAFVAEKTVWSLLASAGRGADPLKYTLRGTDGKKVGTAPERAISFAEEDLLGGIYYWNAGGTTMRYEFGVSGQNAEVFMSPVQAGAATCVGCHVLSRSGKKIAIGMDIPGPANYKVFDVATRSAAFGGAGGGSNFFSFSPDDSQVLTSTGATITLRNATDGTAIGNDPLIASGAMPDFSPDGNTIVYAKPQTAIGIGNPGVDHASLETMVKGGGGWAPGPTLVKGGNMNNYYPSYSPDGTWVMLNRSPTNQSSYDAIDAEVWVVPSKGGAPSQLVKSKGVRDSWPKWAPIVQKQRGNSLMWFTVSSRRNYGLRLMQDPQAKDARAQIWMAAFDPNAAAQGKDGSYPMFWLPFQDAGSSNHIAQWVTRIERKACGQGGTTCDAGEQCSNGRCVPIIK